MKTINTYFGLIILVMFSMMVGCNKTQSFEAVEDLVAFTTNSVDFISVEELHIKIDSMEAFNLIDVREANEYNFGYIPGAINIPRGLIEFKIGDEDYWMNEGLYQPLKDEEFILVCKKGSRSILTIESMKVLGYNNVKVLEGGWKKWELTYPDMYEKNLEAMGHQEEEESGGC